MKRFLIGGSLLCVLALAGRAAAQAPAGVSVTTGKPVVGVPWTGAPGVTETVSTLNLRGAPDLAAPRPIVLKEELEGVEDRFRVMNPFSPAAATWPPGGTSVALPGPPRIPQTLGTTFTAATLLSSGYVPPDTMGAIGPTQFVAIENGIVRTFDRTGVLDGALNTSTDAFFASVRSSSMSDPRVRFDWTSQRWIIVMIDVSTPNRVCLAVSSGATIASSSSFTFFSFRQDQPTPTGNAACLADYPSVGVDVNAVYIGVNQFCPSFAGSDAFVVQKASILGAGPIVVTAFRTIGTPITPQGVDNADPAATDGYIVGEDRFSFGVIAIRRVSTPGATPTLSGAISLSVPATSNPLTQEHLGNNHPGGAYNGKLDGSDARVIQSHIARDGTLWTTHGVSVNSAGVAGAGDRNGVRWYQIGSLATTPVLVQSGTIFDPSASNPLGYTYGSVGVNGQGHAAFALTAVGAASYADAAQTGRLAGDAPGFANTPIKYTAASVPYNPTFDSGTSRPRRWGDYSAISLDPSDEMTLWAVGEYTDSASNGGSWGVKVAQLLAPPPATPASASPPSVAAGSSATVVITGTSAAGSGFFETTKGFAYSKHIAASVSGAGVSVTSVTFTTPTSVSLALSLTAGAAAGARDVTVTNPDGQSATGVGILTVTSACSPPPTPTASNTGPYCAGATVSLSTPTVAGATYAWTGPNGFTSAAQNPTIPGATTAATGTYSVRVTVAGCISPAGTTSVVVNAAPAAPAVTAPATVGAGSPNRTASVPAHAGSAYLWAIGNGTITAGQGTSQITFTAGSAGTLTLSVTETASGCASAPGSALVTVAPVGSAVVFYPVTPCRVLDTRNPSGPLGGPALQPLSARTFDVSTSPCGIPVGAVAISTNVTVTNAAAQGSLVLYRSDIAPPGTSSINFSAGNTRANNTIVALPGSTATFSVLNGSTATVDFLLDVNGYFR